MTIIKVNNTIIIIMGDYSYTLEHIVEGYFPAWRICIYHKEGGWLNHQYIGDCTARTAWYHFYHLVRRNEWWGHRK